MAELTQARLIELLDYNPETGVFKRRSDRGGYAAGSIAGADNNLGYVILNVDRRRYLAHRLAWLYVHGRWPAADLDHKNMDRSDNRLCNLREATRGENMRNVRAHKNNKSGLKGVSFDRRRKIIKWQASIKVLGARRWLGSFETPELAHAAYVDAARELHGDFMRAE